MDPSLIVAQEEGVEVPPESNVSLETKSTADTPNQSLPSVTSPADNLLLVGNTPPSRLETFSCASFFCLATAVNVVMHIYLPPTERPIPIQYLEGSEEYVRNLVNNESWEGETIGSLGLFILCCVVPWVIQMATSLKFGATGDAFRTICTYAVAIQLTAFVTVLIKNYAGYLRPVFFSFCEPNEDYETCTGEEGDVAEGRKSFISGHASFAFCGCILFTLFLERTIGLSSVEIALAVPKQIQPEKAASEGNFYWTIAYKRSPGWRRVGSILSLTPMGVAAWVAASRVVDNLHFPADVVGGALVGACIGYYCHHLWFPERRFMP